MERFELSRRFEPTYRILSQSRYPDFEGKRRKLTDNARVCKPLKNQHFPALEGRKSRKPRQSKEFERNPALGRKKPVGEKMGRNHSPVQMTPTDTEHQNQGGYPHD